MLRNVLIFIWLAMTVNACMLPAPPEQPRRILEPGEFYWAQLECVAGAQIAVTTPQTAQTAQMANGDNNNRAWNQGEDWRATAAVERDFRDSNPDNSEQERLKAVQQQYVEDCIRFKGYGWYMDRMRGIQDWLQYVQ